MARINGAEQLQGDELEGLSGGDRIGVETKAIFAHRPDHAERVFAMLEAVEYGSGTLSPRLIELVWLRIAFWNQCRSCMSLRYKPDLVSEDMVCSLERPEDAEGLGEADRAALRFADLFATDHLAIDESVYDDLRQHFSEAELVELGICCAAYVGFGRLAATWAMHDQLHERFQRSQEEPFTPWGEGALR
jgi:alkylhydroperoxidase family enzyme